MKFEISTQALKQALDIVNHATATNATTPILENILVKINYKNIILTSNNLEMAIEYIINDDVEIFSEWSFCVPSKIFTNYIGLLDDDKVVIEYNYDNSIEIISQSSNIKIKCTPAEEFPIILNIKEEINFHIDWSVIKKAIEKTLFSTALWNIRPNLAWMYVNIVWNKAIFATTDSFRLTEIKLDTKSEMLNSFSQIIPNKTCSELKSILPEKTEVSVIVWENQILFNFWNTKFYSRLLNGHFPDYDVFFPTTYNTKSVINRIDLISALKKINLLSKENNYSIKMSFSKENWILIETSQTQIWEWAINLVGSVDWDDAIIWLNSEYLLEVLGVIESTHVKINFESPLSPILITPLKEDDKITYDFRHIIMPLKI